MGFGPGEWEPQIGPSLAEHEAVREQAKATAERLAKLELWIELELLPKIAKLEEYVAADEEANRLREQLEYEGD